MCCGAREGHLDGLTEGVVVIEELYRGQEAFELLFQKVLLQWLSGTKG